jgi:uncharacterized protein
MTKTTVVYHRADFDGLFCREIAKKFIPDAELIGWDYGDPLLEFPKEGPVYVLDLSPDCFVTGTFFIPRLIWIDHHKTAIDKYPSTIPGYRIDGVAACRLVWQWFTHDYASHVPNEQIGYPLPEKTEYVNRTVREPLAVRLAGEYDIWDKRDTNAELFQHALRSRELNDWDWRNLLSNEVDKELQGTGMEQTCSSLMVGSLLPYGRAIQYAKNKENESIIKSCGFTVQFEGFTLLACNAARYNSQLFAAGLTPEHHGCIGFNWDGKQWRVSLYTDRTDVDLSPVAVKYGGGGHRGACGFRCDKLPFVST